MATPEQLLTALNLLGVVPASRLAAELGVSQPTISRLVASCGPRICRMGRARSTRYGRTRELEGLGSRLPVHRIDEAGRASAWGTLTLIDGGATWVEREDGTATLFTGLPPFAADMSPQGYLGRGFPARFPELRLPPRVTDWGEDQRLLALARRGEDCVGDLVIGHESLDRWLGDPLLEVSTDDYPELAAASLRDEVGSSAGGEHPKFGARMEGRSVLVKFADASDGAAGRRWFDLLLCEGLALQLLASEGLSAAASRVVDVGRRRFLESERFDRVGLRGRRGILSLAALDDEYSGHRDSWTRAARRMADAGLLTPEDARRIRWLDTFGQLIGNNDRHFGNLTLFADGEGRGRVTLAPIYDMLPMMFAPVGPTLVERAYQPAPPSSENLDVWPEAAALAQRYWRSLSATRDLQTGLRERARAAEAALGDLRARVPARGASGALPVRHAREG